MTNHGAPGADRRFALALGAITAVFLIAGLRLVFLGNLNHDEGYYLTAAKLVYEGQVPYRDFAFFQAPLLPYVYGIPQALVGGSLYAGRLMSLAFGAATLLLTAALARRLAGDAAALVAAALLAATSTFQWASSTTRMEPLMCFLTTLGFYALLGRKGRAWEAAAVSSLAWASAVRISCLPCALLVLGIVMARNRRSPGWCAAMAGLAAAQIGLLLGAPLLLSGERMVFDVVGAQLLRFEQFRPDAGLSLAQRLLSTGASILDHLTRLYAGTAFSVLALAFAAVLVHGRALLRRTRPEVLTLAAGALALYLPQLSVAYVGEVYLLASVILLTVVVGCGIAAFREKANLRGQLPERATRSAGASLATSLALAAVVVQAASSPQDIQWRTSPSDWPVARLRETARRVAPLVPPDGRIATFSAYLAVEAGRRLSHGLETSWISFFPALSSARAEELHVVNVDLFRRIVRDPRTAVVALTDFEVKMLAQAQGRTLPPGRPLTQAEIMAALDDLEGRYRLVDVVPRFGQWRDFLYVLARQHDRTSS